MTKFLEVLNIFLDLLFALIGLLMSLVGLFFTGCMTLVGAVLALAGLGVLFGALTLIIVLVGIVIGV